MAKDKNDNTMTATIRLQIIKPLNITWDELGTTLRALRSPMHRIMNRAISELEIFSCQNRQKPKEEQVHPQSEAYRIVARLLREERAYAQKNAEKHPLNKAFADLTVSSRVATATANRVYACWSKYDKGRFVGEAVLSTFRRGAPIIVGAAALELRKVDGAAVLSVGLYGREMRQEPLQLVVQPYGGKGYAQLTKLFENLDGMGDARIQEITNRQGKSEWNVMLAYTFEREPASTNCDGVMAVHRGVHTFFTAAIASGAAKDDGAHNTQERARNPKLKHFDSGGDIIQHKRMYAARRRSLGHHRGQIGNGAKGHGKERRHELITKLEHVEQCWVDSRCKMTAARIMKVAKENNIGTILLDDWTNPFAGSKEKVDAGVQQCGEIGAYYVRTFPLAQLRANIEWAAKMRGIKVEVVSGAYNSRTCPNCGHVHEGPPLRRDASSNATVFECSACQFARNVDLVACWNMLKRHGEPAPIEEHKRSTKSMRARLRAVK